MNHLAIERLPPLRLPPYGEPSDRFAPSGPGGPSFPGRHDTEADPSVRIAGEKLSAVIAFGYTSTKIAQHNRGAVQLIDERMELLSACGKRIPRLEKLSPRPINVQAYSPEPCDCHRADHAIHDACLEISERTDP